jgi:hypothetical protein
MKREINLETKLLKVRHRSRLKLFYLALMSSVSKPAFSNVFGVHMTPIKNGCFKPYNTAISDWS